MGFFGGGTPSFEYSALMAKDFGSKFQMLCYAGLLIAFGVKLPIVPLHTWLPDAHGEATAPVHMLLAGILLKMGGYALLRFNVQLLPEAHVQFAPLLVVLGVVNIIYAALTSFAQRNLKRKIAYSSISHMGFVLIGIGSLSALGTSGALLQMVSHGLIGASLFFLVGATYDRIHTLQLDDMGGIGRDGLPGGHRGDPDPGLSLVDAEGDLFRQGKCRIGFPYPSGRCRTAGDLCHLLPPGADHRHWALPTFSN
jgi:NAD(P)H-quinone oxidoreductase subunit 4